MIIKNCPALTGGKWCISTKTNNTECSKCDDCIIKNIIKKNSNLKEQFGVIEE